MDPFRHLPNLSIDVADITNEIKKTQELKQELKVGTISLPEKRFPLSKRKLN